MFTFLACDFNFLMGKMVTLSQVSEWFLIEMRLVAARLIADWQILENAPEEPVHQLYESISNPVQLQMAR